jgi:hypothetical protein
MVRAQGVGTRSDLPWPFPDRAEPAATATFIMTYAMGTRSAPNKFDLGLSG